MSCGSDVLFIDSNRKLIVFRRTVAGVVYETTFPTGGNISPGDTAVVAIRWTSREQELTRLDEEENPETVPRYTMDVWLNGVKGTPTVAVEGYPGDLYVGSNAGAQQLGSEMLSWRAWRSVLTDAEVEAEMAAIA
jgi:hypothetical protein